MKISIKVILTQFLCRTITLQTAKGHGYLSQPAAVYNDPPTKTGPSAIVDANVLYPNIKWNDSPENNSIQYQMLIANNRIGDLKSFYSKYVSGCPKNNLDTVINVDGLKTMKWQNDEYKEGFTPSHTGPCEAWIDDTKVFTDNDCAARYKSYPAELPIDYSVCKNAICMFSFYWTGLHEPKWQLYKACAMIKGSSNNTSVHTEIVVDNKKYDCLFK